MNTDREEILNCSKYKWPDCPKEKIFRRITRADGPSAKLASDIFVLPKYGTLGVITDELWKLFHYTEISDHQSSVSLTGGVQNLTVELINKDVVELLEQMGIKVCNVKENVEELSWSLTWRITEAESLKRVWKKDLTIALLKKDLFLLKIGIGLFLKLLQDQCNDCEGDVDLLEENQGKLHEKSLKVGKTVNRGLIYVIWLIVYNCSFWCIRLILWDFPDVFLFH